MMMLSLVEVSDNEINWVGWRMSGEKFHFLERRVFPRKFNFLNTREQTSKQDHLSLNLRTERYPKDDTTQHGAGSITKYGRKTR